MLLNNRHKKKLCVTTDRLKISNCSNYLISARTKSVIYKPKKDRTSSPDTISKTGELPESQKIARSILLQPGDYCLLDRLLFHSRIPKSKRSSNMDRYQLIVPEIFIKTFLQFYHNLPMGGYSGIQDTLDRIK